MSLGPLRPDARDMHQAIAEADQRILEAVRDFASLTAPAPTVTARDRLCGLLGYRLYRSLVAGLGS
jgi:hypothetical protein